jgi:hypothetical protein
MSKQQQFLTIVQCGILAYVKDMRQDVAPGIAMDMIGKAIEVAPGVPAALSARQAAEEFMEFTSISVDRREAKPEWLKWI